MGLSWWARLHDEGHDVRVYVEPNEEKRNGDNIVPKFTSKEEWEWWAREQNDTVVFFDFSGKGDYADELRARGLLVVGGGSFCDKLEKDREFGFHVAKTANIRIPDYKSFKTISAAQAHANDDDGLLVFKSDRYLDSSATYVGEDAEDLVCNLEWIKTRFGDTIPCILQKKIKGVAVSTEAWWNGQTFLDPFIGIIEHKKFLNDDLGPSTGCALNAVWYYDGECDLANRMHWRDLEPVFRLNNAPPGIYDINAMLSEDDGEPYFLEWCGRLGYDSEPVSMRGLELGLGDFLEDLALGRTGKIDATADLLYGIKLTVSPAPWEHVEELREGKQTCVGTPVPGARSVWEKDFLGYGIAAYEDEGEKYYVSDPYGIVGIAFAKGPDLSKLGPKALASAKVLRISGLQLRTDGASVIAADARLARRIGYNLPDGLVR